MIVVTHYQRLLDYIVPDKVHVLADGSWSPPVVRPGAETGRTGLCLARGRWNSQPGCENRGAGRKPMSELAVQWAENIPTGARKRSCLA